MIHYLVTGGHPYTINEYLAGWGSRLRDEVRVLYYEQVAINGHLDRGAYIFSDLERLNPAYMELACRVWDTLKAAGDCVLLNNPREVLRREPMLRAFHQAGRNPFAVHRVNDDPQNIRFPVFLRVHNAHDGAMTGLIDSQDALGAALRQVRAGRIGDDDLLIVEYRDTRGTDGFFRKFGAFRVGDQIVPRHILVSQEWMLKYPDRVDTQTVEEERKYLMENPHSAALTEIFRLAQIDYGRIDYSVQGGQIVTWEINTNPTIIVPPERLAESRQPLQPLFMDPFADSLKALQKPCSADPIPFRTSASLLGALKMRKRDRAIRGIRKFAGRIARKILPRKKEVKE